MSNKNCKSGAFIHEKNNAREIKKRFLDLYIKKKERKKKRNATVFYIPYKK